MSDITVTDNTEKILKELQKKSLGFVTAGGEAIRAEAVVECPVDTGNLKSSIITEAFANEGQAISETGPTAEYASNVEYGTGQRPNPFMYRGYNKALPKIRQLESIFKI